jgi:hypothetical protein
MKSLRKNLPLRKFLLSLTIALTFITGSTMFFSTPASPQDDCLSKCEEDPTYQKFKKEKLNGSKTAEYCMKAALYNCAVSKCETSQEKKNSYKASRDKELANAKREGRDCGITPAE